MFDQRQGVAAVTALAQVAQAAERLAGALDGAAGGATHRLRVRGGNTTPPIVVSSWSFSRCHLVLIFHILMIFMMVIVTPFRVNRR